jgi:hypothetical protein
MRSTQFVGLTKVAEDFVKDLEQLESDHSTSGMFEEEIPLRKWVLHPKIKSWGREGECIREVVQTVPWSSGPMIFTCLEVDHGNGAKIEFFEWINDPTCEAEYDPEGGRMWV